MPVSPEWHHRSPAAAGPPARGATPPADPGHLPGLTIIDNADRWGDTRVEAAIDRANGKRIATPDIVRATAERYPRTPGSARVRRVLDRLTFALTDSELERMFRRLVAAAGLPQPLTQQRPGSHRVDFFWPDLGLVVEADSLAFHGTANQQLTDRRRDRAHTIQGLATLRFTHWEICNEPERVARDLRAAINLRRTQTGAASA